MHSFVKYSRSDKNLECSNKKRIPTFCSRCICDKGKKCNKFYENLYIEGKNGFYKCPYGFYSYFSNNDVYTCIAVYDNSVQDVKKKIKLYNDDLNNFIFFKLSDLKELMSDIDELVCTNNELRDTTHDLKNIGGYFNSMSSIVDDRYKDLIEADNDLKALVCLYDLVNYRLSLNSALSEANFKKYDSKLHPILHKLKILLSYKARNKDVEINIDASTVSVRISDNLYLALFILMDNAVKHAIPGTEILISIEELEFNVIRVTLQNRSVVVLDGEIEKLTIRGYRGINQNVPGTGIGLALFKQICDKYSYPFSIYSKHLNDSEDLFVVEINLEKSKNDK